MGHFAPIEHVTRHFDGQGQGVEEHERLVRFGQGRCGVKDGREEHEHGDDEADDLPYVSQVNAQRGQCPAQPHDKQHERQHHQRQQHDVPVRHPKQHQIRDQPYAQTDGKVKQRAAHADPGQHLEWEDHFFDVIDVGQNQTRCTADAFRKQVEDDEAGKQQQGEFGFGVAATAPACLEDDAEDEGVNGQHEDGRDQRPEDAQHRAFVAA